MRPTGASETTILAASNEPMEARRTTMRNAVTCVVGLMLLVGCGDAPGTAASTGLSTNTLPATRQGPPTRKADLVGAITAVTPFEPVTEGCTPPKQLDPNAAVSSDDPPVCTDADSDIEGTILVEGEESIVLELDLPEVDGRHADLQIGMRRLPKTEREKGRYDGC